MVWYVVPRPINVTFTEDRPDFAIFPADNGNVQLNVSFLTLEEVSPFGISTNSYSPPLSSRSARVDHGIVSGGLCGASWHLLANDARRRSVVHAQHHLRR